MIASLDFLAYSKLSHYRFDVIYFVVAIEMRKCNVHSVLCSISNTTRLYHWYVLFFFPVWPSGIDKLIIRSVFR